MGVSILHGKRIAFTGRLASVTREEAAQLVAGYGGQYQESVSRRTSVLVVGKEGWPLEDDGQLTQKFQKAVDLQQQGCELEIWTEEQFLERLELQTHSESIRRRYTIAELTRLLDIPRDRIRTWIRAGLIRPIEVVHRLSYFDYGQVASAKVLNELAQAGVSSGRIRASLEALGSWKPDVVEPLAQLALVEGIGRPLVRLEDGRLAEPHGQILLEFEESHEQDVLRIETAETEPLDLFERAIDLEDAGQYEEAADTYQKLYESGAQEPEVLFNWANVRYALGDVTRAADLLENTVRADPHYAEAWNNLGNVLAELHHYEKAQLAFRQALQLVPTYADAHFNLAQTLTDLGELREARSHWESFLQQDSRSAWADIARQHL